jgi:hypothetical protein
MLNSDWSNLAKQLNANLHGHIHELVGGSFNPLDGLREPAEGDKDWRTDAYQFAHATEAFSKLLWRFGFLVCPEGPTQCSLEDQYEECRCKCTEESLKNMTVPHILASTGIIKSLAFIDKEGNPINNWQNRTSRVPYDQLPGYTYEETQAIYDRILEVLCNPGNIGDMFQATSTNDVTFWILHPTLDRMWHFMRLNDENGVLVNPFDDTWPDKEQSCPGHFSTDTQPFKNLFDTNDTVYTNAQLYELLDPSREEFPYVYEHFHWLHCSHLGKKG